MPERLVVLHIPKTAGSSLHTIVDSVYGKDDVYWYGDENQKAPKLFQPQQVKNRLVLGGHQPLDFYPRDSASIFLAVLREPNARVRSFFSYITRPNEASRESDAKVRRNRLDDWLEKGIRPDSLLDSIKYCKPFREQITNTQCAYLSRGKRNFSSAMNSFKKENFLVGTSAEFFDFIEHLANLFDWPETPRARGNVSKVIGENDVLNEPGVLSLLNELCEEDQKLFDFVSRQEDGIYSSLGKASFSDKTPLTFDGALHAEISRLVWAKVEVRTTDTTVFFPESSNELEVEVYNNSRQPLRHAPGRGLFLVYRLLDKTGQPIVCECPRVALARDIPAKQTLRQSICIEIPKEHRSETRGIRVGLLYQGRYWVDTLNQRHAQDIPVSDTWVFP